MEGTLGSYTLAALPMFLLPYSGAVEKALALCHQPLQGCGLIWDM